MKLFKKRKKLFLILFVFFLLTFVKGISNTISFSESNPMIPINEDVIYLNNSGNNITRLGSGKVIGVYDDNIQSNKELINLDDSAFIIFGLNSNGYLCYQIFNYTNNILMNYSFISTNINFNDVIQNHIHCNGN